MTERFDGQKAQWIEAAGDAFTAIRLVTGYGNRMNQPLSGDTVYAVTQLADMLHNVGAFARGDGGASGYHTPERLEQVRARTRALVQSHHEGATDQRYWPRFDRPGVFARIAQAITGART